MCHVETPRRRTAAVISAFEAPFDRYYVTPSRRGWPTDLASPYAENARMRLPGDRAPIPLAARGADPGGDPSADPSGGPGAAPARHPQIQHHDRRLVPFGHGGGLVGVPGDGDHHLQVMAAQPTH